VRPIFKGRGAQLNPPNPFASAFLSQEPEDWEEAQANPRTDLLPLQAGSIFSYNQSPDLPFRVSLNPYRGCEHGCVYCYARPTHQYLGFSCGIDFESRIFVKPDAPRLLREALASPRWRPQPVVLSGVTDPYQPAETRLGVTRQCLEVLTEARNPVVVVTKSRSVMRDADLLRELARFGAAAVWISITTLDRKLAARLEPRASVPEARLEAIARLAEAGIPVGVLVAPLIPGLTSDGLEELLHQARQAGAEQASYALLRLPGKVRELFVAWLGVYYPEAEKRLLQTLAACRGGKLSSSEFGVRLRGEGSFALLLEKLFFLAAQRAGFKSGGFSLDTRFFKKPKLAVPAEPGEQLAWEWLVEKNNGSGAPSKKEATPPSGSALFMNEVQELGARKEPQRAGKDPGGAGSFRKQKVPKKKQPCTGQTLLPGQDFG
jgi:DNA repair photolyase